MSEPTEILQCPRCDARYRRVALARGQAARCFRCNTLLEAYGSFTPSSWLAIILTAMVVFAIANVLPVLYLGFQGIEREATLLEAVYLTWELGYPFVATLTFGVGFLLPLLQLCLLLWIFAPLSFGRMPVGFQMASKLVDAVRYWSMVPVFLMGTLVTMVKLLDLARVQIGAGLVGTVVLAVIMTGLARLDTSRLIFMVKDMGLPAQEELEPPPTPRMIERTWALIIAAFILYLPANLLPTMRISSMGVTSGHTILGGVVELWGMGSWEVAVVVLIASIMVPLGKLLALTTLLVLTQRGSVRHLRGRTRLYGVVEFIGQWSMLDVFVVILLSALASFGQLMSIQPDIGAPAFGAVVILTMLAAMGFDPRVAWRRAGYRPFNVDTRSAPPS